MSSVFGIMTVEKVIENKQPSKRRYTVYCNDETGPMKIQSNCNYPIGTRIYWEYWYRDKKWAFKILEIKF